MGQILVLFLLQWQQQVSYKIDVQLDTLDKSLTGVEYLTYYNNSPQKIETLYCHLYANAFRDTNTVYARETKRLGSYGGKKLFNAKDKDRGFIEIKGLRQEDIETDYRIEETIMVIFLDQPLLSGDSVVLEIPFYLKIPRQVSRLGYTGNHYEIVHWYPKICVFDESGWHCEPYHAIGEFYGEFGNFEVTMEVPGDFCVAASGELTDEKPVKDSTKILEFTARDVHDFAWIADPDFEVMYYEVDSTEIVVYYQKGNKKSWENAGTYASAALKRYNQWFGRYPYKNLRIVKAYYGAGVEYPNLVMIGYDEDYLTRIFEQTIAHEVAHQWFYGVLGSDEISEPWLDEGFATYAEIRYYEDKYGKENSLLKSSFVPPFTIRYYHQLFYYLVQTNKIEKPVATPAPEYSDMPIAYVNSAYAKPALFLFNLEGLLGREIFDRILKSYYQTYQFRHPHTEDFIKACEFESSQNLNSLFNTFLNSTAFCDWSVKSVDKNQVVIENRGTLMIPADVIIETKTTKDTFRISGESNLCDFSLGERVERVSIDPHKYVLETNRWNNYYPRKVKVSPIFNFPSFESYQILYLPYLWYGTYDGVTVGLYLAGAEFVDFDFVKGRHQWTLGGVYGLTSNKLYPSFSYQTPIIFERPFKSRLFLRGSNSFDETKVATGFINGLGVPFSNTPHLEIINQISYNKLNSYHSVDSVDWEFGENIVLGTAFRVKHNKLMANANLALGLRAFGGDWNYLKTTLEIKKEFKTFVPFRLRVMLGKIFGTAPSQEAIYLSGGLRISLLGDLLFSQEGYFSPQEHFHVTADGNMLGYQTMHIKSDQMYCINLELPASFPLRLFADLGYYGEYAADAGVKLVLGPISLNFPLYAKTDEPWNLRWSIGF